MGRLICQIIFYDESESPSELHTVDTGYSNIGYSDILDIVIFLSLGIFLYLRIPHTRFIEYSGIMVIVIIWP